MKFSYSLSTIVSASVIYGGQEQHQAMGSSPTPLYYYGLNPPTVVSPPNELAGKWEGSHCEMDDPEPAVAELEMTRSGFNTWSFQDAETGDLMPQVGDNGEVIVGYQCVDVGKGYWWGQIPSSDILWCNLFQVDTVDDEDNGTTLMTFHNLAYGGQGAGMLAKGACPTDLTVTMLDPSMKPMQAHFTKQVDTVDLTLPARAFTCDVPAGSTDKVQPSSNSQFPSSGPVPNPFDASPIKSVKSLENFASTIAGKSLPVLCEHTCKALTPLSSEDSEDAIVPSSAELISSSAPLISSFATTLMLISSCAAAMLL